MPTNGARSAIVRPALQAGEVIVEKSPASIAAVGTNWKKLVGVTLTRGALVAAEEEQLSLHDRAAERAAELVAVQAVVARACRPDRSRQTHWSAFSAWSRMNSNASPCSMFVPDLVTALTAAAE